MGWAGGEGSVFKNGWRVLGRQNSRYPLQAVAGCVCSPSRKCVQCRKLRQISFGEKLSAYIKD